MGTKAKLEYIWLDGYKPTQSLRSKTKVVEDYSGKVKVAPMWAFDGSSTDQAEGGSSDCLLKPVAVFPDPGGPVNKTPRGVLMPSLRQSSGWRSGNSTSSLTAAKCLDAPPIMS